MVIYSNALKSQFRSIYALVMREMQTRYGDRKLGFIWAVIEVMAHVTFFAVFKTFLGISTTSGVDFVLYLMTGIIPFFYFRNLVNKLMGVVASNKGLLVLPRISFMDFFYARYILETATGIFSLFLALMVCHLYIVEVEVYDFLQVCYVFCLMGLFGFGAGLIYSSIRTVFEPINIFSAMVTRVLYFTSGVLFSLSSVPEQYHSILYWNPMVHCMNSIRKAFFSSYESVEIFTDLNYVLNFSLFLIFIGIILTLRSKRWALK